MNLSDLEKLHAAVESLRRRESFSNAVERLRLDLSGSQEPFVWSTIAMDTISVTLPASIKSCWIFLLKRDTPSGCHYHPNSVQHMIALNGQGRSKVGGVERAMIPLVDMHVHLLAGLDDGPKTEEDALAFGLNAGRAASPARR